MLGIAIFDRLERQLQDDSVLVESMWKRREIENYICMEEVLLAYAGYGRDQPDYLFAQAEADRREKAMREAMDEISGALRTLEKPDPWSANIKATDDFLDPVFKKFFKTLKMPLAFRKADYHALTRFVPRRKIDPEIGDKLDAIVRVAQKAKPGAE